jgi:hypothetical protein
MPAHQNLLTRGSHTEDERPSDDFSCPAVSAVRLLAVPDVAPPFDGDLTAAGMTTPEPCGQEKACPEGGSRASGGRGAAADRGPDEGLGSSAGRGPDMRRDEDATGGAQGSPDKVEFAADGDWPERFARLLTEALTGSRPARQILPWITERAQIQLRQLMPVFSDGQRPRVLRVITTRPARDVVEMTVIARLGPRTRALAVRLEMAARPEPVARQLPLEGTPRANWLCTDIEAA